MAETFLPVRFVERLQEPIRLGPTRCTPPRRRSIEHSLRRLVAFLGMGRHRQNGKGVAMRRKPADTFAVYMRTLKNVVGTDRAGCVRTTLEYVASCRYQGGDPLWAWSELRGGRGGGDGYVVIRLNTDENWSLPPEKRRPIWLPYSRKHYVICDARLVPALPEWPTIDLMALIWLLTQAPRRQILKNGPVACTGRFDNPCGWSVERLAKTLCATPDDVFQVLERVCRTTGGKLRSRGANLVPVIHAGWLAKRVRSYVQVPPFTAALVRNFREQRKWTVRDLAGRIGVSKSTVARWEAGERAVCPDEAVWFMKQIGQIENTGDSRAHARTSSDLTSIDLTCRRNAKTQSPTGQQVTKTAF